MLPEEEIKLEQARNCKAIKEQLKATLIELNWSNADFAKATFKGKAASSEFLKNEQSCNLNILIDKSYYVGLRVTVLFENVQFIAHTPIKKTSKK